MDILICEKNLFLNGINDHSKLLDQFFQFINKLPLVLNLLPLLSNKSNGSLLFYLLVSIHLDESINFEIILQKK